MLDTQHKERQLLFYFIWLLVSLLKEVKDIIFKFITVLFFLNRFQTHLLSFLLIYLSNKLDDLLLRDRFIIQVVSDCIQQYIQLLSFFLLLFSALLKHYFSFFTFATLTKLFLINFFSFFIFSFFFEIVFPKFLILYV